MATVCPFCNSSDTRYVAAKQGWRCSECDELFAAPAASATNPEARPLKIFLSYGHDQNKPLVDAVGEALQAKGYEIWIDHSEIRYTDDWRRAITSGILASRFMLAFLSKHSVRDPGVCLDEIGIALAHRQGAIGTLLVEPESDVSAPPSVSHIQWLDLSNWRSVKAAGDREWTRWFDAAIATIVARIEGGREFAGEIETLAERLKPLPQTSRIANLLGQKFVGRQWLLNEIEAWRRSDGPKVFWLRGAPGAGKSAVAARLAHLAKAHTVAAHFCEYDRPETRNREKFVCSLAFMLAVRFPGYRKLLLAAIRGLDKDLELYTAEELLERLIAQPGALSVDGGHSGDPSLVVIDALDEAPELQTLLRRHIDSAPRWLRFVVASRPEADVERALAGTKPFDLDADPRNADDLGAFIDQWLDEEPPPAPLTREAAKQILLDRSDGNILFLVQAREGATRGLFSLAAPDVFPRGLNGLFAAWFERRFGTDPGRSAAWAASAPLLELVCASPLPLPLSIAESTLAWRGRGRIEALSPLGSLLRRAESAEGDVVHLRHRSLHDWLTSDRDSGSFWINARDGRLRLVRRLMDLLPEAIADASLRYLDLALPRLLSTLSPGDRHEVFGPEIESALTSLDRLGDKLARAQARLPWALERSLRETMAAEAVASFGADDRRTIRHKWLLQMALSRDGILARARQVAEEIVVAESSVLGSDHPETLRAKGNLASALDHIGERDRALAMKEEVLAGFRRTLGPEDLTSIQAMDNLAAALSHRGDFARARLLAGEVLAQRTCFLGVDHPETLTAKGNLANILSNLGDLETAHRLQREVADGLARAFGPDHPDTLVALSNLAGSLRDQGDLKGAREIWEKVLAARTRLFGPDHPETVATSGRLAVALSELGDLEGARLLQTEIVTKDAEALGAEHPDTLVAQHNLAITIGKLGDQAGARAMQEQLLPVVLRKLGPDHPHALSLENALAETLSGLGQFEDARDLEERALASALRIYGPNNIETIKAQERLAVTFYRLGDFASASRLELAALDGLVRLFGPDHPRSLRARSNLAAFRAKSGDLAGARDVMADIRTTCLRLFGPDHPDTLQATHNLAITAFRQGDLPLARSLQQDLLAAHTRLDGENHAETALARENLKATLRAAGDQLTANKTIDADSVNSLTELAHALGRIGDLEGAAKLHRENVERIRRLLGPDDVRTLNAMNGLAIALGQLGDHAGALTLAEEALATRERLSGADDVETIKAKVNLAVARFNAGDLQGARTLEEEVLASRARLFGPNAPPTLQAKQNLVATLRQLGDREAERTVDRLVEAGAKASASGAPASAPPAGAPVSSAPKPAAVAAPAPEPRGSFFGSLFGRKGRASANDARASIEALIERLTDANEETRRRGRQEFRGAFAAASASAASAASLERLKADLHAVREAAWKLIQESNYADGEYTMVAAIESVLAAMAQKPQLKNWLPALIDDRLKSFFRHPVAELNDAAYSTLDCAIDAAFQSTKGDSALQTWAAAWRGEAAE